MTALLLANFLSWVRVACELRSVSYGSKHASQSLCDFLHFKTTAIYYQRFLFPEIDLHVRYDC